MIIHRLTKTFANLETVYDSQVASSQSTCGPLPQPRTPCFYARAVSHTDDAEGQESESEVDIACDIEGARPSFASGPARVEWDFL
jgi:hypothetical protein